MTSAFEDVKYKASWAISEMPIVPRCDDSPLVKLREKETRQILSLLRRIMDQTLAPALATLIIAYYCRLCPDKELAAKTLKVARSEQYQLSEMRTLEKLLEQLGDLGQVALQQLTTRWRYSI